MMRSKLESIHDHLRQVKREVILEDDVSYKLLGVKWYGEGMFLREEKFGREIKAKKLYQVKTGDFVYNRLFAWKSSFAIVEKKLAGCLVSNEFPVFEYDSQKTNPDFLLYYILQPDFIFQVNKLSGGMSSVSRKRLKEKDFLVAAIPKCSLAIQNDIVNYFLSIRKVNKKFSSELTHQQTLLKKLRQQILQEAIEGKLTAQWRKENPDTEPASVLLEKIKAEKAQLVKEKKIKKQKALPPISEEEKPFELPDGWVWCRLGLPIFYADNLDVQKKLPIETIVNYVDIDCIDNSKQLIKEVKPKRVSELSTRARRVLKKGFIIYSTVRPYLKNIAIIENELAQMIGSTGFNVFKPILVSTRYVFYFLLNPELNKLYEEMMVGFNSPSITNAQFENTFFPVPPLPEQKAIVTKVEKLLALCDQLETRITQNQTHADQLMQAVLKEAFEPDWQETGEKTTDSIKGSVSEQVN